MHSPMKLFFGLTATVSASKASGNSMNSMPAFLQSSISDLRIGREPLEMSVSPRQNFLKPPPVPEMPTVTRIWPFVAFWNSSAIASDTGKTVLEPSMAIVLVCALAADVRRVNAPSAAQCLGKFHDLSPSDRMNAFRFWAELQTVPSTDRFQFLRRPKAAGFACSYRCRGDR